MAFDGIAFRDAYLKVCVFVMQSPCPLASFTYSALPALTLYCVSICQLLRNITPLTTVSCYGISPN